MLQKAMLAVALALLATGGAAATRLDPYKSHRFVVSMNGRAVGGADQVSVPAPAVVKHRAGGDPSGARKSPGRSKFEAISLERGLTQDSEFAGWVRQPAGDAGAPPRSRRSLTLTGPGGDHGAASRYSLSNCWVAHSRALPKLGAGGGATSIEHLELSCERVTQLPSP